MSDRPSENPPMANSVLDYATYDADGLPPWVAEAEALIDARARPRAIRKCFNKSDLALKYFAKSMRRRFGIAQLGGACVGCRLDNCSTAARLKWHIQMPLEAMRLRMSAQPQQAEFLTYHTLCSTCAMHWDRSLRRMRITSFAITLLRIAAIAAIFFGGTVLAKFRISSGYIFPIWVGMLLLAGSASALVRRWCVRKIPAGIWPCRSPGVQFELIDAFGLREELTTQGDTMEQT
ncbi:hypothetical protein BH10PLA1_BH10PLA1_04460 [soil metagenome]